MYAFAKAQAAYDNMSDEYDQELTDEEREVDEFLAREAAADAHWND